MLQALLAGVASIKAQQTRMNVIGNPGIEKDDFRDDMGIAAALEGKGLVVVTGCAHSGVINTVNWAKKMTGIKEVHAVIGGFHLNDAGAEKLRMTAVALKEIGVERVIPCHCTGFEATHYMREALGSAVELGGTGMRIAL